MTDPTKYGWWPPASRLLKADGTVVCPKCEKEKANLDQQYGVMPCDKCRSKSKSFKTLQNIDAKLKEFAIPFWKFAGMKPTEKEKKFEKYLKSKGMSYYDYRQKQLAEAREVYDSSQIKQQILSGKLKSSQEVNYGKA